MSDLIPLNYKISTYFVPVVFHENYFNCQHERNGINASQASLQNIQAMHHCSCCCCWLSRFSRVRLCVTPETAAHQAPPSLGFSTQEHWSGVPFPSPKHESEKWKWNHSVMSDAWRPHGLQPTRLLRPWDLPGKSTGVGCHFTIPETRSFSLPEWKILYSVKNWGT